MRCRLTLARLYAPEVQLAGFAFALGVLSATAGPLSVVHLGRHNLEEVVDSVAQLYDEVTVMIAARETSLPGESAVARRFGYRWQVQSPRFSAVVFVEYVASTMSCMRYARSEY